VTAKRELNISGDISFYSLLVTYKQTYASAMGDMITNLWQAQKLIEAF
jgi:hypothetical protein